MIHVRTGIYPLQFYDYVINNNAIDQTNNPIFRYASLPAQLSFAWLVVARLWCYYFDTHLITFNKNKQWRMAIDPINEATNWYVKNINRWGNEYIILLLIITIDCIQSVISSLFFDIFSPIPGLLYGICFMILFLIASILLYKIISESKLTYDGLGIRRELFITSICYGILIISGAIIDRFVEFGLNQNGNNDNGDDGSNSNSNSNSEEELFIFHGFFDLIIATIITYCIGIYPKQSIYGFGIVCCYDSKKYRLRQDESLSAQLLSKNTGETPMVLISDKEKFYLECTWQDIVSTYEGFEGFMQHLEIEFSTENLLFIQEVECYTINYTYNFRAQDLYTNSTQDSLQVF